MTVCSLCAYLTSGYLFSTTFIYECWCVCVEYINYVFPSKKAKAELEFLTCFCGHPDIKRMFDRISVGHPDADNTSKNRKSLFPITTIGIPAQAFARRALRRKTWNIRDERFILKRGREQDIFLWFKIKKNARSLFSMLQNNVHKPRMQKCSSCSSAQRIYINIFGLEWNFLFPTKK